MANINLTSYPSVRTAFFVKIVIPGYATWLMSNYHRDIVINGDNYTALGQLMGITSSTSELKVSKGELTITISGIPSENLAAFLENPTKGSKVKITRGMFDSHTGELLAIPGNPVQRFNGIINNYGIAETWAGQSASNTINIICRSAIGLLQQKTAGRRTNPTDQRHYFPTDASFDNVPALLNAMIQFGP